MTLIGLTALSVEMRTNRSTPSWHDFCATLRVPKTLFLNASGAFSSIIGTCLKAAAWKTICGMQLSITSLSRVESRMSPTMQSIATEGNRFRRSISVK